MKTIGVNSCNKFELITDEIAPDKSISHRSAMFATLSSGVSTIENFLRAEDTLNTLNIVKHLGADVEDDGKTI
ncbi:MAG: 3-phosphoshikimate 1-carboxyvinyltransferase, partial [Campylobacterota bacterium]|nr:3-phosphoshikimate 1-carboxyvinyltransferase [Campylobacterota bacterium]